ncbi:hypothetical protein I7I48_06786 [Histoplasma ohiense]|nr:hypothetical protein I7I48_06786 [Histoplasma ohiense (nom. inval.)]
MDVEHLIALLTELKPHGGVPLCGEISIEDPIHNRLCVVLDATANVLISESSREVIAAGMQYQQCGPGEKIILILASNTGITNKTRQHALKLTHDLRELAGDFANLDTNQPDQISAIRIQQRALSLDE